MARQPALISPKIKENTHLTQKAWKSSWIFPEVARHRPCDYLPLSSSLISIYFFLQISTFHSNFYKSFPKERSMEIPKGGDIPICRDDSFCYTVEANTASLVSQLVKNSPAEQETQFNSWVRKIPWRRDRLPTLVFMDFPGGLMVKNLPAMWETWV